jgi:1,4-dihydroxy-2-naphthoate octaprenyltransferase
MKRLKSFLLISRANIQIASLPTAALGIILASRTWSDIFQIPVLLFILLFFVVLTYSCHINCLHDAEVDKKYKRYMSDAVQSLGISAVKKIMAAEIALACGLILLLCLVQREPIYVLGTIGILCGYIYSAPPLRVKKRGVLSPLPVMLGLYFLPIPAGGFVVTHHLTVLSLLFGFGYSLIMQGITFINTCEDYKEDKSSGIQTLAHVLGIRKILLLAAFFVLVGGLGDIFLLIFWKLRGHHLSLSSTIAILTLGIFFLFSIFSITKSLFFTSRSQDPYRQSKRIAFQMPNWFLSTRYPLLLISLIL